MPVDQAPSPAPRPAARPKDAAKLVRYDDYIDEKIESTRRMVKFVDFATAGMELAVALLAFLFVYALLEHWIVPGGFSFAIRCVFFTAVLVGVGVFAVRRLWPLCIHAINPVYAAQTIEHGSPTLKNGLINLLLFRQRRAEIPDAVYRTLEEQAAHGLTRVPVDTAVDRSQLIRLGYVLVAIVAIGAVYKVLSPKDPFVAAERVLMPWADLVPASRVSMTAIEPGAVTISRGEYVDVTAEVRGLTEDDSVVLRYTTDDGHVQGRAIPMKAGADRVKFSARLADDTDGLQSIGLTRGATYWLEAGDARSLDYEVTVVPAASILVERVEYDYPAYTGFVDRTVEGSGDIHAIEGTKITVHARANGPIREAHVDFDADGRRDLTMAPAETKARASFELGLRDDRITPKHASYVLRFVNDEGRANHDPVKHAIIVDRDFEPEAGIRAPQEKSRDVRLDEVVAIECEARDPDFMLSAVRLRGQTGGRDVLDEKLLKAEHRGQFTGTYKLMPKLAGLKAGDEVEYWVEASDNRAPKPNTTASERKTLRIVSPNPAQPPPNQLAQNDRRRQQQNQQQGDQGQQGQQGQQGGNAGQQQGNDGGQGQAQQGEGQQGQGQQGQGKSAQGQRNQGDNQQGNESQQGNANQQQGGAGAKSRPDGVAQNAEGNQQNNQQGDKNQQAAGQKQQGGQQSKPGDSNSENNEGDPNQQGDKQQGGQQSPKNGQRPDGAREQASENNAGQNSQQRQPQGGQKSDGQQQQGEQNQGEDKSPVSSEGDNDAEAFNRIQKRLEQNGELKQDDGSSEQKNDGNESQGGQQGQKPGEHGQGAQQQGSKQQGGQQGSKQQGNEQQNGQQPKDGQGSQEGARDQQNGAQQQKDGQQQGGQQKNEQGQGGAQTRQDDLKNGQKPGDQRQGEQKAPGGEQTSSKGDPGGGKEQDPQGSPNSKPGMKPTEKPEQKPSSGEQSNKSEPPAGAKSKKESDSHGEQGGDKAGGGEEGGGQQAPRDGTGSAGQNQSADNGAGQSGEKGKGENSSAGGQDAKSNEKTGASDGKTQGQGSQQREGAGAKPGQGDKEQGKQADKQSNEPQGQQGQPGQKGAKQPGQEQQPGKPDDKSGEQRDGQQANKQPGQQGDKREQATDKQQQGENGNKNSNDGKDGKEGADNSAAGGGSPEGGGKPGTVAMPRNVGDAPDGDAANLEYARKQTDLVLQKLSEQLKKQKVDDQMLKDLGWSEAELRRFVERWQQRREAAERNDASADAAKKELDDALRSLGLQRDKLQQGAVQKDTMRDLQQGYRGPVPAEYKDRLRAYNEGVSRSRQPSE